MPARIRPVTEADAQAIQAIYAPFVRATAISFELDAPTVDEVRSRIRDVSVNFPWLVCVSEGDVAGYAYASRHRERLAYQWSVDVAIYVKQGAQRRGVGRGLYGSLFALLHLQGYFNAYAGVTLPNDASVRLHLAAGFLPVGVYEKVGFKLGQWHDVAWFALQLQAHAESPASPRAFSAVPRDARFEEALASGLQYLRL